MNKAIELLKEAEQLLKTGAFMECCAAERCEECVSKALALLDVEPSEFVKIQRAAARLAADTYGEDEEWCPTKTARLLEACDIIDQQQAENKRLDELVFAYESVRAPVNPLLVENKRLNKRLEAMLNQPASRECPKCGTIIKCV